MPLFTQLKLVKSEAQTSQIELFIKSYQTRAAVFTALLKKDGSESKNAWQYFSHLADAESPPISSQ
ncbi:hypothetical protein ACFLYR_07000 [Chloroflexota bacterium]